MQTEALCGTTGVICLKRVCMLLSERRLRKSMEVNNLGSVASIMFVLVPTVFLLILYI